MHATICGSGAAATRTFRLRPRSRCLRPQPLSPIRANEICSITRSGAPNVNSAKIWTTRSGCLAPKSRLVASPAKTRIASGCSFSSCCATTNSKPGARLNPQSPARTNLLEDEKGYAIGAGRTYGRRDIQGAFHGYHGPARRIPAPGYEMLARLGVSLLPGQAKSCGSPGRRSEVEGGGIVIRGSHADLLGARLAGHRSHSASSPALGELRSRRDAFQPR